MGSIRWTPSVLSGEGQQRHLCSQHRNPSKKKEFNRNLGEGGVLRTDLQQSEMMKQCYNMGKYLVFLEPNILFKTDMKNLYPLEFA